MKIDWQPLRTIIDNNQRFVLSSHVRPDADAIGSELGVLHLLEGLGKSVRIANPSAMPESLHFLDPDGRVKKIGQQISREEIADTDVHIVLDTSAWIQLQEVGNVLRKSSAVKVVIDHHLSSDDLGAIEFKDTSCEATGTLVVRMADALGLDLPPVAAEPLFCAIATDTGWFRFSSTTGETYRTAARLIDLGVRPNLLYRQLYEQKSPARIRLAGRLLGRVTQAADGRIAYTWATLADFKETGAKPVDTEDLVNECLAISGTECAFIVVEQQNKRVKVSLRSRTSTNVAEVASQFGGGGHRQAAGTVLDCTVEEARGKILAALEEALPPPESDRPHADD